MTEQKSSQLPVLLVDDEPEALRMEEIALEAAGITDVVLCGDAREVMPTLASQRIGVVLLDLVMPYLPGLELLPRIVREYPELPVIVVTGVSDVDTAVESMKGGAFDYLVKPVESGRMASCVRRALDMRAVRDEYHSFRDRLFLDSLSYPQAFEGIVTRSTAMRAVFHYVEEIAGGEYPVLISGEPGVGKRLLAKALHTLSGRSGAFVVAQMASVDDGVFSDTLFGHVRGAFVHSVEVRHGLVEQAASGTLFLDEVGGLDTGAQTKLIRLLKERTYLPVGADVPRFSDTRVVAATSIGLQRLLEEGRLRKDLYHLLVSHHIELPPLSRRLEDLPLLLDHFMVQAARAFGRDKPAASATLLKYLASLQYPGNVRELEGMIYDALSRHRDGPLTPEHFGARAGSSVPPAIEYPDGGFGGLDAGCLPTIREMSKRLAEEALRRTRGDREAAALILGVSVASLDDLVSPSEG